MQHHDYADQLRNSQQVAFTGAQTPIPTPEPALNAFVTRLAGNAKELEMVIDRIGSAITKIDGTGEAAATGQADGRGAPCSYLATMSIGHDALEAQLRRLQTLAERLDRIA